MGTMPFLVQWTKVKFNKGLYRALCIRNLTGDLTFDSLISYGVGYSLRRFTVHQRVITNADIDHQQIHVHALLCHIAMR